VTGVKPRAVACGGAPTCCRLAWRHLGSNAGMHTPADGPSEDRVQQRLTDLEIKVSYAEDTMDRLNDVIVRQQAQIDALLRELAALRQQAPAADAPDFRSLRDDLPPHY